MRKKILVVEDDAESRELLVKKLSDNHYIASGAGNAAEVIDMFSYDRPDLMLMDIVLPDTDAYTCIETLQKKNLLKDTAVIFVTGKDLDVKSIEKRMHDLGAFAYMQKPVLPEDIIAKVREVVG